MELIVTRADNSNYNLPSGNSKIVSAVQTRTLMGEDTVVMTVQSVGYINFLIGDWIEVFGRKYTLNTLGEPQRIGENTFEYNLVFEGVNYELTKVVYRSADYSGFNPTSDFPLTGTAESFLTVLQYNLDRAFGQGVWAIGSFPPTEAKTLSFTSENCLLALNRVCSEFGLEYEIKIIGGVKTINLGAVGDTLPLTLEYGKGKGLYSLTRTNVDSKNIVTRLYVEGSDRNVKAGYRDNALRLRIAANAESYIDSPSVASFGIIEGSKIFEDIFPHREGTVSAINASDVLEFTDSSMDFDLAEADSNGTKWLIAGQSAKIHFNTGALAGYEFELTSYNHTTKTFKIKPFKDERGLQFPNPDSAAFQIKTGDKYVILDIIMPDAYIQAAEAELLARGQEYLSQNDQPRVEYSLDLDRFFLKSMFSGPGFDVNFLDAGDYLHIKDSKIGVDKEVRVKTFTRDVLDPWVYQVSLSDVIEPTRIELLLADTLETKKAARQSKLFDPARTRRNWRDVEEVAGMVDTLRAEVALIGSPEGQFQVNSFFEVNKGGNPDSFGATAGVLAHDAFEGDAGSIWNIGAFNVALSNSGAYYLYAKCSKVNAEAVFTVSLTKIGVEDVPGYYHFPVGIISSVKDDARTLTTVHGYTQISGNNISTGIIKNTVSGIEINLQTGEIRGNFKFTSGASVEESIQEQQIYIQYSVNGTSGWHDTFTAGDIYMRQKKGSGAWSSAIRIVGEKGADGVSITLVDVEFAKNTNPTTAPTTGWTTTAPSLAEGEQLWTRTKTTYSSGNPTYSTPANITPKTGAPGAVGQGIDSVTEEYAISTSKTVQPTTGWSTTQPEWSQGQYIWSRVKIVYKNPTSTVYTGYAVSSEWEAVNKLEIGGRNLILNSSFAREYDNWGTTGGSGHTIATGASDYPSTSSVKRSAKWTNTADAGQGIAALTTDSWPLLENGKEYVITCWVKASSASTFSLHVYGDSGDVVDSFKAFSVNTNWQKIVHIITGDGQSNPRVRFFGRNNGVTYWVNCPKVELGNKATDWSPAPEDVDAEIATAKQEALTAASAAQTTANTANATVENLNTYVDGAFKDGVIDAAEAKAIEKYKNTLNETMAKAEASYNKVYTNTYLEGTAKTSLLNAKVNLWGQKDTLLSAINTAISGGTTTPAQKTAVDSAFSTFNNLMTAFQNALEEANRAIQVKLDNISKGYADAVQVGGRNLLLGTKDFTGWINNNTAENSTLFSGLKMAQAKGGVNTTIGLLLDYGWNFKIGEVYTISVWARTDTPGSTIKPITGITNIPSEKIVTSDWARYSWVYTSNYDQLVRFRFETQSESNVVYITAPKIELGNRATDWTPAPEDVPSALDYLATAIQDGSTDVNGGLVATNVMLLKDANGVVRGGMSGLADDNVGFWTGGDYQSALDSLCAILFRKDGSGQVAGGLIKFTKTGEFQMGTFEVRPSGEVEMLDPITNNSRLRFATTNLPSIEELVSGVSYSDSKSFGAGDTATTQTISGSINILHDGVEVDISQITIAVGATGKRQANGLSSSITAELSLYRGGQKASTLITVSEQFTDENYSVRANTNTRPAGKIILNQGNYTVKLIVTKTGDINAPNGTSTSFSMSYNYNLRNVKRQQYGLNGMMLFYSDNHFYFTEDGGLDARTEPTKWNAPGVLFSGNIASGGGLTAGYWGAKYRAGSYREGNNIYRIHHSVGHLNYYVQLTPHSDARMWVIEKTISYVRVQASLASLSFDITIIGNNQ